jgi:hypothetical protein
VNEGEQDSPKCENKVDFDVEPYKKSDGIIHNNFGEDGVR